MDSASPVENNGGEIGRVDGSRTDVSEEKKFETLKSDAFVTLKMPLGATPQGGAPASQGQLTILRKTDREEELRILSQNISGWLHAALGVRIDPDPHGRPFWNALRRGKLMSQVLTAADPSLASQLSKMHADPKIVFHYQENLERIIEVAHTLGVTRENKSKVSAADFFSPSSRREALFFFSGLAEAAYVRSLGNSTPLPPPPLVRAREAVNAAEENGTAAIDRGEEYKTIFGLSDPTPTDMVVAESVSRAGGIKCEKVCDDCYLLDSTVPFYATIMEDLVLTRSELGWENLDTFLVRFKGMRDKHKISVARRRSRAGSAASRIKVKPGQTSPTDDKSRGSRSNSGGATNRMTRAAIKKEKKVIRHVADAEAPSSKERYLRTQVEELRRQLEKEHDTVSNLNLELASLKISLARQDAGSKQGSERVGEEPGDGKDVTAQEPNKKKKKNKRRRACCICILCSSIPREKDLLLVEDTNDSPKDSKQLGSDATSA